jgi:hypothetical protein
MGYHSMALISPEGKVLGAQKALHHNLAWRQGRRSSKIELLHTEFGSVFLSVDVDIYHPEVPRLVSAMGGHYIISSQYIQMGDYNTGMVVSGVWSAAQGSPLYVIGASNQFNCVCAPRPMTDNDDGFVVTPRQKTPLTAKLQAEKLTRCPRRDLLSRRFYGVHREDLL